MDLGIDVHHSSSHGVCTHGLKTERLISEETASCDGTSMQERNEKEGKDPGVRKTACVEFKVVGMLTGRNNFKITGGNGVEISNIHVYFLDSLQSLPARRRSTKESLYRPAGS